MATCAALLIISAGCASAQRNNVTLRGGRYWDREAVDRIVQERPIAPGNALSIHELSRTATSSVHVVQLQGAEQPHVHRRHALVAVVQNGEGVMHIGRRSYSLGPGAVIEIPQGVRHYAVNTGRRPLVAIVIFSPPFDGHDVVPAP